MNYQPIWWKNATLILRVCKIHIYVKYTLIKYKYLTIDIFCQLEQVGEGSIIKDGICKIYFAEYFSGNNLAAYEHDVFRIYFQLKFLFMCVNYHLCCWTFIFMFKLHDLHYLRFGTAGHFICPIFSNGQSNATFFLKIINYWLNIKVCNVFYIISLR